MYKHIMVPLDGSELAECVLPHVEAVVMSCQKPRVSFVRVVTPFHLHEGLEDKIPVEERRRVEAESMKVSREYLEQAMKKTDLQNAVSEAVVVFGDVNQKLVEFAEKNAVDLILFSTHGRSGISRWVWGSTADRILRSACVPVFMVRAPGCVPGV